MHPKQFDHVVALCVDYRFERELERINRIMCKLDVVPRWFINGNGEMLHKSNYAQFHIGPPSSWQDGYGSYQHFRAFQLIIADAKAKGYRHVLVVEDDLILTDDFDKVVGELQVPDDWDMLYYGANHTGHRTREVNESLLRCFGSACTHMVAFRETIYDAVAALPIDRTIDWNIANRLHEKFNCYAVWPSIALQKPNFSSLWKQQVDYTELFKSKGEPV